MIQSEFIKYFLKVRPSINLYCFESYFKLKNIDNKCLRLKVSNEFLKTHNNITYLEYLSTRVYMYLIDCQRLREKSMFTFFLTRSYKYVTIKHVYFHKSLRILLRLLYEEKTQPIIGKNFSRLSNNSFHLVKKKN